jgi:autotransporter-associated beta strand protein
VKGLGVALLGAVAPTVSFAQVTTTWVGSNPGSVWTSNGNWTNNAPGAADTAVLPGGTTANPFLTTSSSVGTLTMNSSGGTANTLFLGSNTLTAGSVNITAGNIAASGGGTDTLTVTGTMLMTGGGTLGTAGNAMTVNAASISLDNVTVASNVTVNASNSITFNPSSPTTFSNNFQGAAQLTVQSGSVTLSGNNSYTGTTQVSGTLTLGSSTAIGSGSLFLVGGTTDLNGQTVSVSTLIGTSGTLNLNGGNITLTNGSGTFGGQITGTGNITKQGVGNLDLQGTNTYNGTFTISAGSVRLVNGGSFGTGNIVNNSQLVVAQSGTTTISNAISGSGELFQSLTGGTTVLTGSNSYGNTTVVNGTLQVGDGGNSGTLGTGGVSLTNANSTLAFNRNDTVTIANAISGAGGVTQAGSGTTVLTGANTYSGTTTISAGTLQIGDAGATGTLGTGSGTPGSVSIASGSTLAFNRSDTLTVANALSGAGTIRQDGGTTILTGVNTLTGQTIVNAGTLRIGTGSSIGSGDLAINGGTLDLNGQTVSTGALSGLGGTLDLNGGSFTTTSNGGTTGFTGPITGNGNFTKAGSYILDLHGTNDYVGTFTISGGFVRLIDGSNFGTGNVVNDGAIVVFNSGATTISNAISGGGELIVNTSGNTVVLTGANTYSGQTTIVAGTTLQIGNGGTTGSLGTGTVDNGFKLAFNRSDTLTVANAISGGGFISQDGGGTTILTGNNSYGSTQINAGTLQVGDGGTSGTLGTISVTNNSALVFNRSDTLTVNNVIGGSGSVTQAGTGTTILGAVNNYGGGTAISAGTLKINIANALPTTGALTMAASTTLDLNNFNQTLGSLNGSGTVALGSGTLTIDGSANSTFAGTIGGTSGGLTKSGTGTLTLSGTNTYVGPTTVNGGTLVVNGSLAGVVTINAGATLGGSGTISGGSVVVAGTVAPGNSIGTLTVAGAYTQTGTYIVEANSAGQSDRINVGGVATLTGGSVSVQAASGHYQRSTTYTILSATGGLGGTTFTGGVTSNFAFLTPSLSYTATDVLLTLLSSDTAFQSGAQTPNQRAVGAVLDRASPTATGDFDTVLNAISVLDTTQGPRALDAIGGQQYSTLSSMMVQATQLFMDAFQLQAGRGAGRTGSTASVRSGSTYVTLRADNCVNTCDVTAATWGAWGGGIGAAGTIVGDGANASGANYNLAGFVAGLDRRFSPTFRAGIATGFNAGNLYMNGLPGAGNANNLQFALYGEMTEGRLYVDGLAGYAHANNYMTRPIVIPGLNARTAQGATTANTFFGQLEAGYKIPVGPRRTSTSSVTPFARLQGSTTNQAGFTESGADSLNLTVAGQTTNSLRSVVGLQVDAGWSSRLDLMLRAGWSHEYADASRPVNATLAGAPALGFTTFGAAAPRDGVVVGFGAYAILAERTSLFLRYDGDYAGQAMSHALSAGVRYIW